MKRKSNTNSQQQPKVRSHVGLSAIQQTGAGTHGGGKRRRNRRDRSEARRSLREFS